MKKDLNETHVNCTSRQTYRYTEEKEKGFFLTGKELLVLLQIS